MSTMGRIAPAPGEVRCERQADDTLLVRLVGNWRIYTAAPVVTEVYQQLDASSPGAATRLRNAGADRLGQPALDLCAPGRGGEHAPADGRRSAWPAGRRPTPPGTGRRRTGAGRRTAWGATAILAGAHRDRGARRLAGRPGHAGLHWGGRPRLPQADDRTRPASGASIWSSSCRNAGPRRWAL